MTAAPRRRRWVPWVVAYGSSLLIAAATLAGYGVSHYAPVAFIGGSYDVGPSSASYITRIEPPAGQSEEVVAFTSGKEFSIGFDMGNAGRYGVTVLRIPMESSAYWRFDGAEIAAVDNAQGDPQPMIPFHAFALAPNHMRFVRLHFHFPICPTVTAKGGGYSSFGIPVTFRLFWFTRHEVLVLPDRVLIQGMGPGCP